MTENKSFLYNTNELSLHSKQVLYTVCFVILCFIDQIKNSAPLIPQEGFVNLTGLCIAAIILSHFKAKDFFSLPYLIWVIYFFCGVLLNRKAGLEECDNAWQWYTAAANVGVFGLIAIRLILGMITKKEKPQLNLFFFPLWCIIMIGMMLSRHDAVWPLWFFVMFGCFYLTNFTKEEWETILKGLMNGIIIGFFLLQGFACMFRAYVIDPRYHGIQLNGNMYALFCLFTAVALLSKLCQFHKEKATLIHKFFTCLAFGIITGFLTLSIGRTAFVTLAVVFVIANLYFFLDEKHFRISKTCCRISALFMSIFLTFPFVFYLARWIQPEFESPFIIADDAYKKTLLRTDTPEDQKNYIEFANFIKASFGRFDNLKDEYNQEFQNQIDSLSFFPIKKVYASPWEDFLTPLNSSASDYGSGTSKDDPYLTNYTQNSIAVRRAIYRNYFYRLNKTGHIRSEDGFWLFKFYFIPHAHNLFLQFSFNFGFIIGTVFISYLAILAIYYFTIFLFSSKKEWIFVPPLLFLIAFIGFSLFEINWRIGHLTFTLLFIFFYSGIHKVIICKKTSPKVT